MMAILTDALPAVRYGDADVGVLSAVRHQIICLLVATRSSCLFARARPTDKQGNYLNRLEMHHLVFKAVPFVRCCLCFWLLRVSCFYIYYQLCVVMCSRYIFAHTLQRLQGFFAHRCVAGVGVLLCAMCLSVLLLCLRALFLQVSVKKNPPRFG